MAEAPINDRLITVMPPGADVLGMTEWKGRMLIATTNAVYELVGDELQPHLISQRDYHELILSRLGIEETDA